MCIANIANQVEFLNLVSNEDQNDDKATPEGYAELDRAIEAIEADASQRLLHDVKVDAAKVEMFDELVDSLNWWSQHASIMPLNAAKTATLVERARKLQRRELP